MTLPVLFCIYLAVLVVLAWQSRRRSTEKTPHDFYLAGGQIGFLVLLATLFATQYSGNTFMAFPGRTYRIGYAYMVSVPFMMAMIIFYLLYAPQLRRVAGEHRFVTPCDWIHHRYRSLPLTLTCAVLMSWALLNFFLAQLMAMGHIVSGLTDGRVPYAAGVLFLALVIVIYETVGGMRAVAWTDTLQGALMVIGVLTVGGWLLSQQDKLAALPQQIAELAPGKVRPPSMTKCATWISSFLILGIGGSMYPQGIQRIYAAKSTRTLKRSLTVMVFLPLLTVLFAYYMGLFSIIQFPDLEKVESDRVMAMMLNHIASLGPLLNIAVSLLLLAALAAIMSTADSVLLSLSSMLVQDFYAKSVRRPVAEDRLLHYGKLCSWILVAILVAVALKPGFTLWRLLEVKFEILMQVAPAFVLGFYRPNLTARGALAGIAAGTALALTGFFMGGKWFGFHPGTIGCAVNCTICLVLSRQVRTDVTPRSRVKPAL